MKKKIYKAPTTEQVAFATEFAIAEVSKEGPSMSGSQQDFDENNRSRGHSNQWLDDEQ